MRHGIVVCAFVLAAGLFLSGDLSAGSLEPPGPPAPTMKTLSQVEARTPILSLPVTIAAPGSYYLTGDLIGVSGQPGINITSSFVTLDLNGFSLIGVPGSGEGIRGLTPNTRNVVIRNGVIRNWASEGITGDNLIDARIEDLRIALNTASGMVIGGGAIVRNTTATQNGGYGMYVGGSSTIIGCVASRNQIGIVAGQNSVVSSSTSSSNVEVGISLEGGSMATDCTAQSNGTQGFALSNVGARVVHSVARLNVVGISGLDGVSVEECSVDGNTDDGIRVASRGRVRGNFARGNTNDGIQATGTGNRIEDNESTQNGVGIRVDAINNLVIKNSAYQNTMEYSIVAGNQFATPSVNPNTAGPWANFDL